ncbi:MAG: AmmeMemoRadiSam system protein B [Actinomycetota bacterium]|nr:AmmeMemoRadiSam system protein B [Actinomycetota bacterium]
MTLVRRPAVAGSFYPADPTELAAMVDAMLAAAHAAAPAAATTPPVAIIVPHAGFVYSGPVAATAYARVRQWQQAITRVVVIGPAHRVPVHGLALSSAAAFATPLGPVPIDHIANGLLARRAGVYTDDGAHELEHSIEVHLPFLQRVLGLDWSLVPIIAGAASATMVADALEMVWGADGTLVVVSTDLSHYHDQRTASRMDAETAAMIVSAQWEEVDGDHACGAVPVRGALELTRRHTDAVTLLDLRTSGDTAGPAARVVGYGSFLVS